MGVGCRRCESDCSDGREGVPLHRAMPPRSYPRGHPAGNTTGEAGIAVVVNLQLTCKHLFTRVTPCEQYNFLTTWQHNPTQKASERGVLNDSSVEGRTDSCSCFRCPWPRRRFD